RSTTGRRSGSSVPGNRWHDGGHGAPPILIEAVAGLALLGALATALASAVADPATREAAVVTFVVTASGVTLIGVGGAFWGLVAGCLMLLLFHRRSQPTVPPADGPGPSDHSSGGRSATPTARRTRPSATEPIRSAGT
ncbi:benzoate/H(+) symporter BenE family transporter, partial [Micromonospora sp. NPDC002411]